MSRASIAIFCLIVYVFSVNGEQLNVQKDSVCTRNNLEGTCVSPHRCLSSKLETVTETSTCISQNNEPIMCCTDCTLVNDTRDIILDPNVGILHRTGPTAKNKCIDYLLSLDYPCKNTSRVKFFSNVQFGKNCSTVNEAFATGASYGEPAERDEFPHMALLGYAPYGNEFDKTEWLCGGSVISERFILTAAHCLSRPLMGQVKYIALGILKRTDPPELWQKYNVQRRVPYPEYKPPSKYHDIALLETDKPITFGIHVRPACLHTEGEATYYASATGWGALKHGGPLADNLQVVYLQEFEKEECGKFYRPQRHLKYGYNHTTQMCYGHTEVPKDTCQGDSGGPLQTQGFGQACMYIILGVTSFGPPCGIVAGSGMYTRIIHYVPWIESIVWP